MLKMFRYILLKPAVLGLHGNHLLGEIEIKVDLGFRVGLLDISEVRL